MISEVRIAPEMPRYGDTVRCEAREASDPDGDAVAVRYAWKRDGTTVGTDQELVVNWVHGDELVCVATPNDGKDDGPHASANVRIGNTPPMIKSIVLSPRTIYADSTVSCLASASDADNTPVTFSYLWTRNGKAEATGKTYTGQKWRGDEVTCTAVPHDGTDPGEPASLSSTVVNSVPYVYFTQIEPPDPVATDTLTCPSESEDPDGDSVTVSRKWMVNGAEVSRSETLATGFKRGDDVTCVAIPNDGMEDGLLDAVTVTILNSPPRLESVEVRPSPAYPDTPLTCVAIGATDPDGEPVSLNVGWMINDRAAGIGETLSVAFQPGDRVRCVATSWDGTDPGESREASITISSRSR